MTTAVDTSVLLAIFKREPGYERWLDLMAPETAHLAGRSFRAYRDQGGPRNHLIPDFLIGAHGQLQADGLLALDRGFFRRYFRRLEVVEPGG